MSKLTERIVKLRLTDYLSNNSLLNSFQSAYIKCHSTEITLLSVHDQGRSEKKISEGVQVASFGTAEPGARSVHGA